MPTLSYPHLPLIKTKNLQKNVFETFFSLVQKIARKIAEWICWKSWKNKFFLAKISTENVDRKFPRRITVNFCGQNFRQKKVFFHQNFFFRTKISKFFHNFDFWPKFPIGPNKIICWPKMSILDKNFVFFQFSTFFFRKYIFWLQKWNLRHRLP